MSPEIAKPEQPPTYGRISAKAHPLQILEPTNWMQDEGYTYECVSQA
jgi:hypothetical protein